MLFRSQLKNARIGTLAPIVFYAAVGILFLALLPFASFPPHIALTGIMNLITAYGLLTRRFWATWLIVALFFIALTISLYTLYFVLFSNWLVSLGMIVYVLLTLYFTYRTRSRRKPS
jgi:SNF family Na+-dependent transporter